MSTTRATRLLATAASALALAAGAASWSSALPEVVDLATDPRPVRFDAEDDFDAMGARATSCDVNGDGIGDLVVGASDADGEGNGRRNAGEVYIVYGRRGAWRGPQNIAAARSVTIIGDGTGDQLGEGVTCGDVNGDGYDDIVACAIGGDGPDNSRPNAGQAHVIFGGPALAAVIDLRATPVPVIYGEQGSYSGFCDANSLANGDINGDGRADVVLGDQARTSASGAPDSGRAYVVVGRAEWPASFDLRTQADVLIYGRDKGDGIGDVVATGDLNVDGTADLFVGARLGDGPSNQRKDCGETAVFRGRGTWPATIDLLTTPADMTIFGVDAGDATGSVHGVSVGDVDVDGRSEIWLGAGSADGKTNTEPLEGEVRLVEPGSSWPATIDLRSRTDRVIYGGNAGDELGRFVYSGHTDADRRLDLVSSGLYGDGPNESRPNAGEVVVFRGRATLPAEMDVGMGDEDLIIYGPEPEIHLFPIALCDLNGDGIDEIVPSSADLAVRPSIWLVSALDTDADGVDQLADVCPLVYDPRQEDGDGDGRGDACATDWDGDGAADVVDCAIADASAGTPPSIAGVRFAPASKADLTWDAAPSAESYDVARGDLPRAGAQDYGRCVTAGDPDPSDTHFTDPTTPVPGRGFFYLVRGRDAGCGGAGTWGKTSQGTERSAPAACP